MIIKKMLNNNAVVAVEHGREVIVRGKGVAYQKNVGSEIEADKIEKVYTLSSPDIQNKFKELIGRIPNSYMQLTDELVLHAREQLSKELNDSVYITLADHICMSVERISNGTVVKNVMLWDIKRFYKKEFQVGLDALELIEKRFQVRLPEDEAGFIALHIVNAQLDEDLPVVYEITKVMQEMCNIVKYSVNVVFDEDSVYYYRFITHLKFFAQRLFSGREYQDEVDDGLLETIKDRYPDGYLCSVKIREFIGGKYQYGVSGEEQLYLTIHIEKVVREFKNKHL